MSHVEVELKLAAKGCAIEAVRQCISTLSHQYSEPTKLTQMCFHGLHVPWGLQQALHRNCWNALTPIASRVNRISSNWRDRKAVMMD